MLYHTRMDNIKEQIVWAAGFLDGEGTITIKRYNYKDRHYYTAYISCSQTIKGTKAIKFLKDIFGGHIYQWQPKGNRLETISWCVTSKKAELCAKRLLPYLIIKRKQTLLLLKFCKTIIKRTEQYRLKESDYENREKLFYQMRKLNVKGKLHLQRLSEKTPKGDAIV